jgi:hypothetical protein
MYFLETIVLTMLHLRLIDIKLLGSWRDAHDLGRARWQVFHHGASRPAQQHRFQTPAQQVEILIAQDLAFLVRHAVPVVEAERRTEPPVVDELHDGEQIIEPILERSAGEHERER